MRNYLQVFCSAMPAGGAYGILHHMLKKRELNAGTGYYHSHRSAVLL